MNRKQIHASVNMRVDQILDFMDTTGAPGNVTVSYHRDKNGVKKVTVTHEETWAVEETGRA